MIFHVFYLLVLAISDLESISADQALSRMTDEILGDSTAFRELCIISGHLAVPDQTL